MSFDWGENVNPDADGYTGTLNHNCLTIAEGLAPGRIPHLSVRQVAHDKRFRGQGDMALRPRIQQFLCADPGRHLTYRSRLLTTRSRSTEKSTPLAGMFCARDASGACGNWGDPARVGAATAPGRHEAYSISCPPASSWPRSTGRPSISSSLTGGSCCRGRTGYCS